MKTKSMALMVSVVGILVAAGTLVGLTGVYADHGGEDPNKWSCMYHLTPALADSQATVFISPRKIKIHIKHAKPNTLYTVWTDFRNGAAGKALADDHPGTGFAQPVAPTFKTTQGVKSGMGLDKNGKITSSGGNAEIEIKLNYDLLALGASPLVALDLVDQGPNRLVGGGWLRVYNEETDRQLVDVRGRPIVARATAQGITIVGHTDFLTHGHTPGTGGVDYFSGFSGDFPAACLP